MIYPHRGNPEDSTRQVGVETVPWVHAANKAGKWYRGDTRKVHGQSDTKSGKL